MDLEPGVQTILDQFDVQVARRADRPAMRHRTDAGWETITWGEYGTAVDQLAAGLLALGVDAGDRVSILSFNRPQWHVADLAILAVGAVSVPIYPTSAGEQVAYILGHCGARVCFLERSEQLGKVLEHRDELPELTTIVVLDGTGRHDDATVMGLDELAALGRGTLAHDADAGRARRDAIAPGDLATLVYTSGTTGPPKGAMITHANLMATMRAITTVVHLTHDERFLSFLPLSHITERCVSHFGVIVAGGETWFARSFTTVADDLPDCRPTLFFAVPRVWEKFREGVEERVEDLTGARGVLARMYLASVAARADDLAGTLSMPAWRRRLHDALDRVVGATIRESLGLDRARFLVSGAAPIHPALLRWLHALGLPVAEGYGQTEVSLATTLNPPGAIRIGTVGPPLPGVEVKIAPDEEIIVRGDNVCAGYYRNEAATAELLDAAGWMHSGDLGRFDDHGYLLITGRKKDLIITAHGKNVAPQVLETDLRAESLIGHAVVVGDGRRYLTALISLDPDELAHWAHEHGRPVSPATLATDPDVHAIVAAGIANVNERHARAEGIRKWRILPGELSIANGELTPTLKVRRVAVQDRYAELIEEMYAGD
ncbi:MAG TPA: long-chain fatty acid--CoA ligase [Acidimicrobiia bacterium]|nr:long-chain fatty acid--CoA ligase [Acidimicrobiia bacterium]